MTSTAQPTTAAELAARVRGYKTTTVVLNLALPAILSPDLPLLGVYRRTGTPPEAPVILFRSDGSEYDSRPIRDWLEAAPKDRGRGLGLGEDLMAFGPMYVMTRIGDSIDQLDLRDQDSPLMEFVRHLRNACAHGNRWHFKGKEPRYPATFRSFTVDESWHGGRALYAESSGALGPGDFLELLDDLAEYLDTL